MLTSYLFVILGLSVLAIVASLFGFDGLSQSAAKTASILIHVPMTVIGSLFGCCLSLAIAGSLAGLAFVFVFVF